MENFLAYAEDIQEKKIISCPVDKNNDFTVLAVDDFAKFVIEMMMNLTVHAMRVYRLTAPSVTMTDFLNIIEGYVNETIEYNRLPYEDYVEDGVALGFFDWQMIQRKQFYEVVDNLSLIVSNQTQDFVDVTGKQPLGLAKYLDQNKASFVDESMKVDEFEIRSSIQARRDSARQKSENTFGLRRASSRQTKWEGQGSLDVSGGIDTIEGGT